jgi:hypothetical protein
MRECAAQSRTRALRLMRMHVLTVTTRADGAIVGDGVRAQAAD